MGVPIFERTIEIPVRPPEKSAKNYKEEPQHDPSIHENKDTNSSLFKGIISIAFFINVHVRNGH